MPSRYNFTTTRRGKDEPAIEEALKDERDALQRGDVVVVRPTSLQRSHWEGRDQVKIQSGYADFAKNYKDSPAPIKSAVKVLYRWGLRGDCHRIDHP